MLTESEKLITPIQEEDTYMETLTISSVLSLLINLILFLLLLTCPVTTIRISIEKGINPSWINACYFKNKFRLYAIKAYIYKISYQHLKPENSQVNHSNQYL